MNRLGAFGQQVVSKKVNPYTAARRTNETFFDYGDVGRAVQHLRTHPLGIPFVTWLAKNIPAQVKRLPSRANVELMAANRQLSQEASSPDLGPPSFANQADYVAQRLGLPIPGINRFAYSGLPQADLNRLTPPPVSNQTGNSLIDLPRSVMKQWSSDLSPISQIITTMLTNASPLTGDPLMDRVPASGPDMFIRQLLGQNPEFVRRQDEQGNDVHIPATGGVQKLISDTLFPPFGNLSRVAKYDAPGNARASVGPFKFDPWQLLSAFGGVTTRPIADKMQTRTALIGGLFDKTDAQNKLLSHLKDLATKVPIQTPTFDENGLITNIPAKGTESEVAAYNRAQTRLNEIKRIYDALVARP
jgi:hypothetical protein